MGKDPTRMVGGGMVRIHRWLRWARLGYALFFILSLPGTLLRGQTDAEKPENLESRGQQIQSALAARQAELAERYRRLENLLLRMADFDQAENPHRAELLKKAFALSREKRLGDQFEKLASLLKNEEYGSATDNQKILKGDLDLLLKLLLTEDQSDRNKSEQARLREYIKELERMGRLQRSLRGRTENRLEPGLSEEQAQLAERAGKLDRQIAEDESPALSNSAQDGQEAPDNQDGKGESTPKEGEKSKGSDPPKPSSPKSEGSQGKATEQDSDKTPSSGESKESERSQESQPSESNPEPSESKPTEGAEGNPSGAPQPSSPGESPSGQPGESSDGQTPPQAPEPPARKQIRIAQDAMEKATEELEQAKQSESVEQQRNAEAALAAAKAELERILRQLREEEIERVLTMLETRFRRMLEMQVMVHTATQRLQESRAQGDQRVIDIEAGKLGFEERRIVAEADKALVLLRAEGSSVAFPETVEQMRMDMDQVADRLSRGLVESITQGLEEEIIATLEELLDALKQSQKEQEQRKQSPPTQGASAEDEQGLLDRIAELKMIKALQVRINKRTLRYAELLKDFNDQIGQAEDPELRAALKKLAEREADVRRITREAVLGKNQ
jgi:hypothetical protein